MKTTLNKIRACGPCRDGWEKLLRHLDKTKADDEPVSILTVLESNGLDDALWCLRAVEGHDREIRLYAVFCARQVQHLMADPRSLTALDVAERFANGLAGVEELNAAWDAAWDAAVAEARAVAGAVAGYAARAVAGDEAGDAAVAVAWDAAQAVAGYAARAVAGDEAGAVARNAARNAAWAGAVAAARASQEAELVRMCREIERSQHDRN